MIKITSKDMKIRKLLYSLFYDVLNIDFHLWTWVRNLCKYGDQFLLVDHHPDHGIMGLMPMPVNEVEREEGFDEKDPTVYRFRWATQGNRTLEPWQVIHIRHLGNDNFNPYGSSIIEAARRTWRQLVLLEDAVMIYRIVRSPERRVFYIDVGGIDPNDVAGFIEKIKSQMKRSQVVDSDTGAKDMRYNPLSIQDDYFIPVRGDITSTRIESLAGGQYVGDIDDLNYVRDKLFAALKIPKSYLGYEGDISNKAALTQEDINFARTIARVQQIIVAELNKLAIMHLFSAGYRNEELMNFELSMASPSIITEIQRLELWRTRMEVAGVAQEGMFDRHFVYDRLFKLSDEDIEAIEEGKRKDKLFDMELEAMQPLTPDAAGEVPLDAGGAGGEVPPEGGGEIPPGEAPQAAAPEETPEAAPEGGAEQPITTAGSHKVAGRDPNQQRAMPNSIKGQLKRRKDDYIKNPSSLLKHAFGMEKNALDPMDDIAYQRRIYTAPFGESKKILRENQEVDEELDKRIFRQKMLQHDKLVKQLENIDKSIRKDDNKEEA